MMRHVIIACDLVLLSAVAATSSLAQQPTAAVGLPTKDAEARDFHLKAQAAFEAGDYEQARGLFLQAWSIKQSAAIALGLGQSEAELKRYRDCAEHLDIALRALPETVSESVRAQAKKTLAEAKVQVAVMQATTNRPGAEVRVDGRAVGKAPLPGPLFLEPGTHDISAHLGSNSITRPVAVMAGQEYALSLPLISRNRNLGHRHKPARAMGMNALPEPGHDHASIGRAPLRSPVPIVVGAALFASGLATAIVFRLNSDAQYRKAEVLRSELAGSGCTGSRGGDLQCSALEEAAESGDRSRNLSTVGFAVAGAALAGTLTYWLWPSRGEKATSPTMSSIHIGAGLTDHGSGLVVSGNY